MTVNKVIMTTLTPLGFPVEFSVFTGAEKSYITFNYSSSGADYADDEPQHERFLVQIHFFFPPDYNPLVAARGIKRALRGAGFSWPEVVVASDDDGGHFVFECEYIDGVD
jgi:hypothetical protein